MRPLVGAFMLFTVCVQAAVDCESQDCDLKELLETCRALEKNPQIKPFTSKIVCRGSETYWTLKTAGSNTLGTNEVAYGKVTMKGSKYAAKETGLQFVGTAFEAECRDYKEMLGQYTPVQKIINSCDELETIYMMGQASYCHDVLKQMKAPLVAVQETGFTHNTCDNIVQLGGQFRRVQQTGQSGFWYEYEVTHVEKKGMCCEAGLHVGDRVVRVNNTHFNTLESFERELKRLLKQGTEIRMRVFIKDLQIYDDIVYQAARDEEVL